MINNKKQIVEELKKGICELTLISEQSSASCTISATLSTNHLPDEIPEVSDKPHIVVLWNLIAEKWESFHASEIGEVERLTGIGIKDDQLAPAELDLSSFPVGFE